jgi:6-phosphogluconolactonase (cycloisomerase 2 family)
MGCVQRAALAFVLVLTTAASGYAQQQFVFTNDDVWGQNTVSAFKVQSDGSLFSVPGSPFATGGTGTGGGFFAANRAAVHVARHLLFVSNSGSNDISVFRVDRATGVLALVAGSPFSSAGISTSGISLASTPDGRHLLAANSGSRNVAVFRVAPSGALSGAPGGPYQLADAPDGIRVSPNGRWLTVALVEANLIDVFSIGRNGGLVRVEGSPFPSFRPAGLDINCTGDLLFAGQAAAGTQVSVFGIDNDGRLTSHPNSPFYFNSGSNGNVAVLNPADDVLFVSNQDTATVTALRVGRRGGLGLIPGSPFAVGGDAFYPSGTATDATGKYLYVANFYDQVAAFRVRADGSLRPIPGSPFRTGQGGGLLSLTAYPGKSCAVPVAIEVTSGKVERLPRRRHGNVRVAVRSNPRVLDLSTIDVRSVTFEGAPVVKASRVKDRRDGTASLILTFSAAAVDVPAGSPSACIFGALLSGRPFSGCVAVPQPVRGMGSH